MTEPMRPWVEVMPKIPDPEPAPLWPQGGADNTDQPEMIAEFPAEVGELPAGVIPQPLPPIEEGANELRETGFELAINPELAHLIKPVRGFKVHPKNIRKHHIDSIIASLAEYGQMSPILVQKSTNYIVKGNGTFTAAKKMGVTQMAIAVVELDDDTAYRFLLADNRTSDLAGYERKSLLEALNSLIDGPGLQGTLWTADDVDDLRAEAGQVVVVEPETFTGGYAETEEQLAARIANSEREAVKLKPVRLLLPLEEYQLFISNLAVLRADYGTQGNIATIVEAVRREAARLSPSSQADKDFAPPADSAEEPTEDELIARLTDIGG